MFSEPAIWMSVNMLTMWLVAPTLVHQPGLWLYRLGMAVFYAAAIMLVVNLYWWMSATGWFNTPWRCLA